MLLIVYIALWFYAVIHQKKILVVTLFICGEIVISSSFFLLLFIFEYNRARVRRTLRTELLVHLSRSPFTFRHRCISGEKPVFVEKMPCKEVFIKQQVETYSNKSFFKAHFNEL